MSDKEIQELFHEFYGNVTVEGEDPKITAMRAFNNIDIQAVGSALMKRRGEKESEGEFIDRREAKELDKFMSHFSQVIE